MKAPEGASQVDQDMPQQCCDHACPLYFTSQVDAVQPSDRLTDTCCYIYAHKEGGARAEELASIAWCLAS
jgi:hypothetical protein